MSGPSTLAATRQIDAGADKQSPTQTELFLYLLVVPMRTYRYMLIYAYVKHLILYA